MEITRRSYPVDLYTAAFKVEGIYQPIGNLLDDMNRTDIKCIPLSDATFTALDPRSPLRSVSVPQVVVSKEDLLFLCFKDENTVDEFRMLPRAERIISYTSAFALRGDFHLGAEQQVRDMLDTMRGRFQPVTDVTVFPLFETKVTIPRERRLAVLDIQAVQMYHAQVTS
jgi:hypothetical protein